MTISASYAGRVEVFWVGCTISAPVTPSVYCVESMWRYQEVLQIESEVGSQSIYKFRWVACQQFAEKTLRALKATDKAPDVIIDGIDALIPSGSIKFSKGETRGHVSGHPRSYDRQNIYL